MSEPKKILVVDDDALVLKSVIRILKSQGYQTLTAESGAKAIELVRQKDFDLVISDIRMPDLDGIETVQIIKEHYDRHGKVCAFAFITGYAGDERTKAAHRMHNIKLLFKPFEVQDLLDTVALQLQSQEDQKALP